MKTYEIKNLIIAHLSEFWELNQINTRFDVISYLIAYYGAVNEQYIDAINLLAAEGYIKQ